MSITLELRRLRWGEGNFETKFVHIMRLYIKKSFFFLGKDLVRWLGSREHLLLFQRTLIQFSEAT